MSNLCRLAVLLTLLSAACLTQAADQPFPSRPVRIIVPFTPGSGVDIVARTIGVGLEEAWKRPLVIENRAGAGGTIAGELVAKANPDGYTLMLGNVSTLAIARGLYPRLGYDSLRDFAPITLITTSENVVVVHPSLPVDSVKSLIAYAKSRPGQINYASSGSGTTTHLGGAMLASMAGVQMTHVPYKGSVQALADLLGGATQLMFSSVPTALPHIRSGRLRPLADTRLTRSPVLPELPTVHEAALPGYEMSLWQGLVAPAGTPKHIIAKVNADVVAGLKTPEQRARFTAQSFEPVGNTPAEFAAYIRSEADKWAKVIKASGAKPE